MLGKLYSIGSSMVITLLVGVLILSNMEYRVVVLPLPVGPVFKINPLGCLIIDSIIFGIVLELMI